MDFLTKIPSKFKIKINTSELDLDINEALNIKIDLSMVKVKDILLDNRENYIPIEVMETKLNLSLNKKFR